eukprot:3255074-Amphidinium_carterae.1
MSRLWLGKLAAAAAPADVPRQATTSKAQPPKAVVAGCQSRCVPGFSPHHCRRPCPLQLMPKF